ncbi:uncharacterized protein EI90DRAFT_506790 [Cantharellus anzutake]|uniref:uncharacterized protein n=1 Tax=Cantharellus anzutake TaxID=1750568 RepID=UPI001903EAD7|nr:uncharacterized protein EI90DRAFT_506790 [Cantharellus anzutake]KAF8334104.1 hypothetical protein EI90DRAFT_506790 [Cantharellus anzutake]
MVNRENLLFGYRTKFISIRNERRLYSSNYCLASIRTMAQTNVRPREIYHSQAVYVGRNRLLERPTRAEMLLWGKPSLKCHWWAFAAPLPGYPRRFDVRKAKTYPVHLPRYRHRFCHDLRTRCRPRATSIHLPVGSALGCQSVMGAPASAGITDGMPTTSFCYCHSYHRCKQESYKCSLGAAGC